jgi:hypothetical protein
MGKDAAGGPEGEGRWVALFESVHYVLAAEKVFKELGVWYDVVPVPAELSSDCGVAIEFRAEDSAAVAGVLADARASFASVWRPSGAGYEEMPAAVLRSTDAGGARDDPLSPPGRGIG